jgi:uncharacterized membrane protein YccC
MKHVTIFAALAATCLTAATPALAQRAPVYSQQNSEEARFSAAQQRFASELAIFQAAFDRYQQTRRDPRYNDPRNNDPRYNDPRYNDPRYNDDRDEGDYDPAQYYRDSPRYQERVLTSDDRVYRGRDGKYYCKRNDGTTGLIVGGIAGGVLGNVIDGGHSRGVGTVLGALVGAVAGSSIDRNSQNQQIRCR